MVEFDVLDFGRRDGADRACCGMGHQDALLGRYWRRQASSACHAADRLTLPTAPASGPRTASAGSPCSPEGRTAARTSAAPAAKPDSRSPPRRRRTPRMSGCPRPHSSKQRISNRAGPRRRQPEVGDHPRHHVHLGAELGHVEIVQDVDGAEQHLDRLADRQMQVVALDHRRRPGRTDRPGSVPGDCPG